MVDFVFEVDSMPVAAEKYKARDAQIVGGGGAANAACAIAKLGGHAQIAARVGDDFMGKLIIDDLKKHSVDCSLIATTSDARSSYSSVLLDTSGERQIVNFRGDNLSEDVTGIESTDPAAVLSDTRWIAGATAAMKLAKRKGIPSVLDAEAPIDPRLLKLASHIAFSRQGLESIVGTLKTISNIESALRQLAERYSAWLAVTDGANGVYSLHRNEFLHHAAIPVDAVDTLGAGDVWHGAFTFWLGCGYNESDAVGFANAAAALKCAHPGGGRSCPGLNEVEMLLSSDNKGA